MDQLLDKLITSGRTALLTGFELLRTLGEATIELGAQGFTLLRDKTTAVIRCGGEKLDELSCDSKRAVMLAVSVGTAVLAITASLLLLLRRKK
ncbi:MAG: hypothetical protein IJT78_01320 [Oscillospiraceae bacterium]|nr:hypothetical protein [Oscillospiraceae bacterium]